ncbi:hypothetical protein QQ045_002616 [Rhodiola kirilowii]
MGKQGPCCHCGVPSTPLWRNGPPDKPVLCNACGSRWRTKGSLTNYTPLHSRAEPDNSMDYRASRIKIISGRVKEANFLKRKRTYENVTTGNITSDYNDILWKAMDDDTSNRSSSGSVVSNSESNAQFDATCVNGLTGFSQYVAVNTDRMKPAKKRTSISRPTSSSIAMLAKDLCTILHQQQSSGFYGSSEEDLLFECGKSFFSSESGHGSYLIRDTSSITREEDSEASSFSVDNKLSLGSETCSYPKPLPVHMSSNVATDRKYNKLDTQPQTTERNTVKSEISESYGSQSLQLMRISLKDVFFTHEESLLHLTTEEQEQPLNCFPSVDDSMQLNSYPDENHNQDLLLDVPSNKMFQEAELIFSSPSSGIPRGRPGSCSTYPTLMGQ